MPESITTQEEALSRAIEWAEGKKSWANLPHQGEFHNAIVSVMDACEVIKLVAVAIGISYMPTTVTMEDPRSHA